MKGVSTIIATILMLMITIALAGMAYVYITGVFTTQTQGIEIADSYCGASGAVTFLVRNLGTTDISSIGCIQTAPSTDAVGSCNATALSNIAVSISAGASASFTDTCGGTGGRSCIYRFTPPVGRSVSLTVTCM